MSAEIYSQQKTTDATGQIKRTWVFLETIECYAYQFNQSESWAEKYNYDQAIKLRTPRKINNENKVHAIYDSTGAKPWSDQLSNATVFDIITISPILDAFGQVVEWESILSISELQ